MHEFCDKFDHIKNLVPNKFASDGIVSKYSSQKASFAIKSGKCNNQWIPRQYCYLNIYKTCAEGFKHGFGVQRLGDMKCQASFIRSKLFK